MIVQKAVGRESAGRLPLSATVGLSPAGCDPNARFGPFIRTHRFYPAIRNPLPADPCHPV